MTETDPTSLTPTFGRKLGGTEKLLVELGPLGAFFVGFFFHERLAPLVDAATGSNFFTGEGRELYLAVLLSLPAFAAAFIYSAVRTRRISPMLAVSGVLVAVMGALTFIFQSKTFVYMKPTIIYGLVGAVLAGGALTGRYFLKTLFDGALDLTDAAWRTLTWRFASFHFAAAIANEILWRSLTAGCAPGAECAGEGTWVTLKVFGFPAAFLIFSALNAPFIVRNSRTDAPARTDA